MLSLSRPLPPAVTAQRLVQKLRLPRRPSWAQLCRLSSLSPSHTGLHAQAPPEIHPAVGLGTGAERQGGEWLGRQCSRGSLSTLLSCGPRALMSLLHPDPRLSCPSARRREPCGSCPLAWEREGSHGTFWLRHRALGLALITSLLGHKLRPSLSPSSRAVSEACVPNVEGLCAALPRGGGLKTSPS